MDLFIKIALGVTGFASVIIGVCSKTFDSGPKKRLTFFGWSAILCALIACSLGAYSEVLRVRKDKIVALDKIKSAQDVEKSAHDMETLRAEIKDNEAINAIHISKADAANKELEKLRGNLESLEAKVQDPAVRSMIHDVRKTIKVDNTELTGKLSDVSKTLIALKDSLDKTSSSLTGMNADMKATREAVSDVHGDIESTKALVATLKSEIEAARAARSRVEPDASPEAAINEVAGVSPDADAQ